MYRIFALVVVSLFFWGCAAPGASTVKSDESLFLNGTISKVAGNKYEIAVTYPDPPATSESIIPDLAGQVIRKTIFAEGGTTEINGTPVIIENVGENSLTVKAEQVGGFARGNRVRILIPKKQLAVVDIEMLNTRRRDMGRVLQESLTSELVESGHFIILERAKLKTVLDEIRLSKSGLTRETSEVMAGKIINADFILTGTMAEIGDEWNINLRLLNVRTSQAVASIVHNSPLFEQGEQRDMSPLAEDFEQDTLIPWNIGYQKSGEDYFKVSIDRSTGASGSASSLRVDFDFTHGSTMFFANASTKIKRDLSQFKGVELYVKGSANMTNYFSLLSSQTRDANRINNWVAPFEMTTNWKKITIPFESLVLGRDWIKEGAKTYGANPGDQQLRLNRVEAVRFGLKGKNLPVSKGTFWIDKISFYR